MKKILFVINTLGRAGAEMALFELFRNLEPAEYEVSLYVLTGQGEMIPELPEHVRLLNSTYSSASVFSGKGRRNLMKNALKVAVHRGTIFRLIPYLTKNLWSMVKNKKVLPDKLLWRVFADGAERFDESYDLAVAYLEGGSTYYVADHVKARKKAAFVHVDYRMAGYSKQLDQGCYRKFCRIFTVSDEVKEVFLSVYPECKNRTEIFHNLIDPERIRANAERGRGFKDGYEVTRILSVGCLTTQKAFEVSIDAMKQLKDAGENVRWYVLGEGDQRKALQERINRLGLSKDFILCGAVKNPYPYMKQADLYVHASRFEGKSIAIQEAQILGKPMVVSDCSGNREQVKNGVDGLLVPFTSEAVAEAIGELIHSPEKCARLGEEAKEKNKGENAEMEKLLSLLED